MLRRAFLILVLVFAESTIAGADDYRDGISAYGRKDYATAFEKFRKAAENFNPSLEEFLPAARHDNPGVSDDDLIDYWLRVYGDTGVSMVQSSHLLAQFFLGMMYDHGEGVPQDYAQAVRWYRKAAEQGHTSAQFSLGEMYFRGQGVPKDNVLAYMWANLAAAQGGKNAIKIRDTIEQVLTTSQLAEAQELARKWKPMMGTVPTPQQDAGGSKPVSSGTGFIVSRQGYVLTNHHVIEGCTTIRATTEERKKEVTVVGADVENDLAVLKLPGPAQNVARFREGRTIRSGDSVVVVGFPLHGLLASAANMTTGIVSALAGLGNDARFVQITAPVQPGNSGGPLLDQSNQVVGIVVSKLNALKVAKSTGDIPQNINFAINGAVAKLFLDSQGVEYETGPSSKKVEPAEIGAAAKKFTLLVECYR